VRNASDDIIAGGDSFNCALVHSFAEFLVTPFRIFVTFIHEGGRQLAAPTGNSVQSLSVAMNGSGERSTQGGVFPRCCIQRRHPGNDVWSLLLVLIRRWSPRLVLVGSADGLALTTIFGT
jgi:hypothetical protein